MSPIYCSTLAAYGFHFSYPCYGCNCFSTECSVQALILVSLMALATMRFWAHCVAILYNAHAIICFLGKLIATKQQPWFATVPASPWPAVKY